MVGEGALDRPTSARAARALGALGLGALVSGAAHFDLVLCPCAALFGLPCPGCGLTRAAARLLCGDLRGALQLHPLSPLLLLVVLMALAGAIWQPAARAQLSDDGRWRLWRWLERWQAPGAWVLLLLVLGVWIARFWGAFGGPVPI